jgi:hypothetical protein
MDELTKIALVGTSKYAGSLPEPGHPAAALVTGLADDDRERSILLRCGARAAYNLAGPPRKRERQRGGSCVKWSTTWSVSSAIH